jgi:hypothetical protein
VGDAVPPLLAKVLGLAIIDQLQQPSCRRSLKTRLRTKTLFE